MANAIENSIMKLQTELREHDRSYNAKTDFLREDKPLTPWNIKAKALRKELFDLTGDPYGEWKNASGAKVKKEVKPDDELLTATYLSPDEVPQEVAAWIQKNASILTSDATDAVRWGRIVNTHKDDRYPAGDVTIYRAIGRDIDSDEIRPGDWVTTIESYATEHNDRYLNGKGAILSETIDGLDLLVSPTGNMEESIYAPLHLSGPVQRPQLSAQKAAETVVNKEEKMTRVSERVIALIELVQSYEGSSTRYSNDYTLRGLINSPPTGSAKFYFVSKVKELLVALNVDPRLFIQFEETGHDVFTNFINVPQHDILDTVLSDLRAGRIHPIPEPIIGKYEQGKLVKQVGDAVQFFDVVLNETGNKAIWKKTMKAGEYLQPDRSRATGLALIENIAAELNGTFSAWRPSGKNWQYADLTIDGAILSIGVSDGGVVQVNQDPFTASPERAMHITAEAVKKSVLAAVVAHEQRTNADAVQKLSNDLVLNIDNDLHAIYSAATGKTGSYSDVFEWVGNCGFNLPKTNNVLVDLGLKRGILSNQEAKVLMKTEEPVAAMKIDTGCNFKNKENIPEYRIAALARLISIADGKEERPIWQGTNFNDGWRALIEDLSIVMGKWTAYHGCDHDYFQKRWDEDSITLLKSAIANLNDEQQKLFVAFTEPRSSASLEM